MGCVAVNRNREKGAEGDQEPAVGHAEDAEGRFAAFVADLLPEVDEAFVVLVPNRYELAAIGGNGGLKEYVVWLGKYGDGHMAGCDINRQALHQMRCRGENTLAVREELENHVGSIASKKRSAPRNKIPCVCIVEQQAICSI